MLFLVLEAHSIFGQGPSSWIKIPPIDGFLAKWPPPLRALKLPLLSYAWIVW